jgi:hypothetical protein
MQEGGAWLAAVRTWIQWNAFNGEHVHWGSDDIVRADFTVRKLEELAAAVVAAERNERNKPNAQLMDADQLPPGFKKKRPRRSMERLVRVLVDCPKCGAKPPTAHALGGGPHFDGIRTCGNSCGTWEPQEEWQAIRDANHQRQELRALGRAITCTTVGAEKERRKKDENNSSNQDKV